MPTQPIPHHANCAGRQVIVPKPLDRRQRNREYDARRRTDEVALTELASRIEKWTIPEPNSGCLLWFGATTKKGYGLVGIGGRKGKSIYAHRLAYTIAKGAIPEGLSILHRCDNRCCCNPDHLFVGSPADNTNDMINKDRHCRGERSPMAKLSEDEIPGIRRDPRSLRLIALDHGVDIKQIHRIKRRENWRHVR